MGESQGGKYGVKLALYALNAIQAKQLNLNLGGKLSSTLQKKIKK